MRTSLFVLIKFFSVKDEIMHVDKAARVHCEGVMKVHLMY